MNDVKEIRYPEGFDWQIWVDRLENLLQTSVIIHC